MPFAVCVTDHQGNPGSLVGVHPGEDRQAAEIDVERHRVDLASARSPVA